MEETYFEARLESWVILVCIIDVHWVASGVHCVVSAAGRDLNDVSIRAKSCHVLS